MKAVKFGCCAFAGGVGAMITAAGWSELDAPAGAAIACMGMMLVLAAVLAAIAVEVS